MESGTRFPTPLFAVTLDKGIAKKLVRSYGLPTPDFSVIEDLSQVKQVKLKYPLFAKPIAEGTGKGISSISLIETPAQLEKASKYLLDCYAQPVLVEEFLPGREFTVGVLGTGSNARALGIMEIEMLEDDKGIYSYEAKENCEKVVRYSRYAGPLSGQLNDLAVKSYVGLQCRDAGRVDIRLDAQGQPSFLEVNPLPGLHPTHSDLPMIATQEGMSYPELIGEIIKSALERYKY